MRGKYARTTEVQYSCAADKGLLPTAWYWYADGDGGYESTSGTVDRSNTPVPVAIAMPNLPEMSPISHRDGVSANMDGEQEYDLAVRLSALHSGLAPEHANNGS